MKCPYDSCGLEVPALSGYRPTTEKLFEFVFDNGQTRRIKRSWGADVYAALKSIGYGPVAMVSGVVWEWRELAEVQP